MSDKTYGGVEYCDLSSADKEKVNQGIIEEDGQEEVMLRKDHLAALHLMRKEKAA